VDSNKCNEGAPVRLTKGGVTQNTNIKMIIEKKDKLKKK
jgi:hypothetical protein